MSIWGKVIGGMAGFAFGGPLGALMGGIAGHAVDRMRDAREAGHEQIGHGPWGGGPETHYGAGPQTANDRQVAFTVAIIVLAAKMAKADGHVSREEIDAFKRMFHIPPEEAKEVGRLFDEARRDAKGFEPYAAQVGQMFARQPAVLEELLGMLFHIAMADGVMHPKEMEFLGKVSAIFGFDPHVFERVRQSHMPPEEADPYEVLGVDRSASDAEIKSAWRKLTRENHPDKLVAEGLPQEFVDQANEKMANINAAYDAISKERGIK